MTVPLRFHVYGTFYGHLPNRWLLIKALLKSATKIGNATIAFGKLRLAPLLASTAVTFLMNHMFRRNHHPLEVVCQMERPMSV